MSPTALSRRSCMDTRLRRRMSFGVVSGMARIVDRRLLIVDSARWRSFARSIARPYPPTVVRLLRLGNSTDLDPNIPERERSAWLSAAVFARETRVDPQLTVRTIWPTANLPERLDGWLDEHEPDLVF